MIFDYNFTSRYLSLDSGRLHFIDKGEGETVVLVHGNPTWSYYYRTLIQSLSKTYRVIAPDHLGCGLSEKPQEFNYSLKNHINNLSILLDHLDIKQTSMVVHDWGGTIGLGTAAKGKIDLEKLVILNTAAYRSTRIPLRIRICRWPVVGKLLVRGLNGFAGAAIFMAVTKKMDKDIAAGYLAPYDSWNNRIAVHEFVKDIPLHKNHKSYQTLVEIEDSLERLAKRELPVSILWGGKDFCFDDYFYHEWKRRFPYAECHYYSDWGHYVLEDGKGRVEPVIEAFLAK